MGTGLIYSPRFLDHDTGPGHPERPERVQAIIDGLQESAIWKKLDHIEPVIHDKLLPALVHDPGYVKRVALTCDRGEPYIDSFDNPISGESYKVALLAANAVAEGVDYLFDSADRSAIVLPRPPGHHAEYNQAMGFCIFNNVAIAARYAQQKYSLNRIAIIDFDVHHGNGTQHLFETDPNVLYVSVHRFPFYPGTGAKNETGRGDGIGRTVNYPLEAGTGDDVYLDLFNNSMVDKVIAHKPELLILSSGFDAHELDPLGGMAVTTEGFRQISEILNRLSQECCQGRVISVLEGGYSLKGLAEGMNVHIGELIREG